MSNWRTSFIPNQQSNRRLFCVLTLLLVIAVLCNMCMGAVSIAPQIVLKTCLSLGQPADTVPAQIILYVRLPRTCGCLLAGAALAVSGAVIQCVLHNPLAAPNIIGVNSGAGFMVALCSAFFPASVTLIPLAAFIGALGGVLLVLCIAERSAASKITLVLAGVAVSSMFSAGIDTVLTFVPDSLSGYSDFRIGGFSNLTIVKVIPAFWVALIAFIGILALAGDMDVLALGAEMAQSLGLAVRPVRMILLALAAALAGAAVSFSGLLGFVGLIVPHIMRRLAGEESRILIPACALGGGTMILFCDLLARLLFAPFELPVGIVMSLLGAPFFIWLLLRQRGGRIHD